MDQYWHCICQTVLPLSVIFFIVIMKYVNQVIFILGTEPYMEIDMYLDKNWSDEDTMAILWCLLQW